MAEDKKRRLTDPADDALDKKDDVTAKDDVASLDPEAQTGEEGVGFLSPKDVGAVQDRKSAAPHPFDGYRLGPQVMVDKAKVSSTFIVMLKPHEEPPPDLSNARNDIYVGGDGKGTPRSGGKRKTVTLPTSHTRVAMNRHGTSNEQVVFDRDITLSNGQRYKCAIIREHSIRAQIVFEFDPGKNRVMVDRRYMLADTRQAVPLRQLFNAIYHQRTRAEQAAKAFDAAQESTAADKE